VRAYFRVDDPLFAAASRVVLPFRETLKNRLADAGIG
jgi:hypothetical protein